MSYVSGSGPDFGEDAGEQDEKPERSKLRQYAESISIAVFVALVLRVFVVEAFQLPEANANLLYDTAPFDHLFVVKPAYLFSPPARGDLILFSRGGHDYISRVVGLPGERIDVSSAGVRINGHLHRERYVLTQGLSSYTVVVPDRNVFVMADNRAASFAGSLYWGAIPFDEIRGKYWLRWWPWRRIGTVKLPPENP
jgi:signal peptidase I